jgi:hypothetical protein
MNITERQAWHGAGASLEFEPGDFEIVDLVLGQIPELRLCAAALKRARAANLPYPIPSADALKPLFGGKIFDGGGHRFGPDDVAKFMPAEFFPIGNEGELVSRMYVALVRCKHEDAVSMQASPDVLRNQQGSGVTS